MQRYSFLDLQAFAAQIYRNRSVILTPYGYGVTFASIAPGAVASQVLSITANADFILTGIRYRASIAAAAQNISTKTAACARILLVDSGSNEQLTNGSVDLENYSTNGADARDLPYPRFIQGRSAMSIQISSYAAVEIYSPLELYLEGVLCRTITE